MKPFTVLYDRVLGWSRHRHAPWYLGGLSFAESSFFPIPPDVMLAPMSLARPEAALRYAGLTTLASVLGGLLGYLIGFFLFVGIEPLILEWGYGPALEKSRAWFDQWGFWAVLLAGFSPIPYKIFTIAAGSMAMAILPFLLASAVGRGLRFYLVATLMARGGPRMEALLRRYVEWLGWLLVLLALLLYFGLREG